MFGTFQVFYLSLQPTDPEADIGFFEWGYGIRNGPSKWSTYFPGCSGQKQSPIDISPLAASWRSSNELRPDWKPVIAAVVHNDGRTLAVNLAAGSTFFEGAAWKVEKVRFLAEIWGPG
jgi:carbonic anhydrase